MEGQIAEPQEDGDETLAGLPTDQPAVDTSRMSARQRQEKRQEDEKDALNEQLQSYLRGLDFTGDRYKVNLYRVEPKFFRQRTVGSAQGMLVESYTSMPEIEDIQRQHGGEKYYVVIKGPDPSDPRKTTSKRFNLPLIAGDPKTVSTPNGGMPLDQVPVPVDKSAEAAQVNLQREMLTMFKEVNSESKRDMREMLEKVALASKPVAPTIDPAAQQAIEDRRAAERMAHEKELKRIETEGKLREKETELRLKEIEVKQKADEAEKQRQHEWAMKQLEIQANERMASMKNQNETIKEIMTTVQTAQKETVATFEKTVEKLSKKDEDPFEKLMKVMELQKMLKDSVKDDDATPPTSVGEVLKASLPQVTATIEKILGNRQPQPATGQQQPVARLAPNTVGVVDLPAPDQPPAQLEAPKAEEPALDLAWPAPDSTDIEAISRMLAENIEKALRAGWESTRIHEQIVKKFPELYLLGMKGFSIDQVMEAVDKHVPEDATLRSPRGRKAIRIIHGLLRQGK